MNVRPVRNIIFDFGGVICNIDISLTEKAFAEMGMKRFDTDYSVSEREDFFGRFETGEITPAQFRSALRPFFTGEVNDADIDVAWNALLLDMPEGRIALLKRLRKKYRLFLLSNTNPIHYRKYLSDLREIHGLEGFHDLFEKAWFSFRIGLRKPFREAFGFVLRDAGLRPEETLFIDDSVQHVEGARRAGILAYHLSEGEDISGLFGPGLEFLKKV